MKRIDCFLDAMKKMILPQKISEAKSLKGILGANGFKSRHREIDSVGAAFLDYVRENIGGSIVDLNNTTCFKNY